MIHPTCGHPAKVLETREGETKVRRRYSCKHCAVRFTTFEAVEVDTEVAQAYREQLNVAVQLIQSALKERLT